MPTLLSPPCPRTLRKDWRIMGLTDAYDEFLVVMGVSRSDCEDRLADALFEYGPKEMREIHSLWIEEWVYDDLFDRHAWNPVAEISLRRWRLRAAALDQHARRRSA